MCHGCGRALEQGEAMFEVARTWFYCTFCVLPGVAGEFPIVGEQILIPMEFGYDCVSQD